MRGTVSRQCWCREQGTRRLLRGKCPDLGKKGHGSWYGRYDAPPAGGKRRQVLIGPFATKTEAEAALATELAKAGAGLDAPDRKILTGAYLDAYLAGKISLKPSTLATDAEAVDLYWKPGIGHIRLAELRDSDIAAVIAAMQQVNRPQDGPPSEMLRRLTGARYGTGGQEPDKVKRRSTVPLSASRIRRITAPLSGALTAAEDTGRIGRNPLRGVTMPRRSKVRPLPWTSGRVAEFRAAYSARAAAAGKVGPEKLQRIWASPSLRPGPVMVWLSADGGTFLDFIAGDRFYALFHLATLSGMRRGEIAALPWSEVSLADGVLHVRDSKSDAGVRDVFLDDGTTDVLKAWRRQQAEDKIRYRKHWTETGRVFTRETGCPVPGQWMSSRFETLAFRSGVPPVRFHDLRHFAASLGLAAGQDMKVVAEQLGHARSDFTRDYYAVVTPAQAKAAAEAAAALIPRRRASNERATRDPEG